jgi:hypothetical protein
MMEDEVTEAKTIEDLIAEKMLTDVVVLQRRYYNPTQGSWWMDVVPVMES